MGARKVPFGRYHLQDLGPAQRVMRGEGEFVGEGAYGEFKKLATVFYAGGPGLLVHPVWQTSNAYFVELSLPLAGTGILRSDSPLQGPHADNTKQRKLFFFRLLISLRTIHFNRYGYHGIEKSPEK